MLQAGGRCDEQADKSWPNQMFAHQTDGRSIDESTALDEQPPRLPDNDTDNDTNNHRERKPTTNRGEGRRSRHRRDKVERKFSRARNEAPTVEATESTAAAAETRPLEGGGGAGDSESDSRDNIRLLQRIARGRSKLAAVERGQKHRARIESGTVEAPPSGCCRSSSLSCPSLKRPRAISGGGQVDLVAEKWSGERSNRANNYEQRPDGGIHLDSCQHLAGEIEFGRAEEVEVAAADHLSGPLTEPADVEAAAAASLPLICGQLLTLVCGLIVLLYLVELTNRGMTNLFSKILGGGGSSSNSNERRRSLAAAASNGSSRSPADQSIPGQGIMQSQSSSTLALPRNSSPLIGGDSSSSSSSSTMPASSHSRRSSRSSIHSVSALFMNALTGGRTSNANTNSNGKCLHNFNLAEPHQRPVGATTTTS